MTGYSPDLSGVSIPSMVANFVITRFGVPESLIFDNATYFSFAKLTEYALEKGIKLKYSANYYPRTSTKARIFPRRFSTFLTFWCKIRCNRNEASLYPRLAVSVSTPGLLDVDVSMPKLLDVVVSTPDRLYSDGTVFCFFCEFCSAWVCIVATLNINFVVISLMSLRCEWASTRDEKLPDSIQ